jgi:hypothetical protein
MGLTPYRFLAETQLGDFLWREERDYDVKSRLLPCPHLIFKPIAAARARGDG